MRFIWRGLPRFTKSAGELPYVPVANAIYDVGGVRIPDLPITPEKVLRALKAQTQRA